MTAKGCVCESAACGAAAQKLAPNSTSDTTTRKGFCILMFMMGKLYTGCAATATLITRLGLSMSRIRDVDDPPKKRFARIGSAEIFANSYDELGRLQASTDFSDLIPFLSA